MIGQRIFPNKYGGLRLPEGGYGKDLRSRWWVRPPGYDSIKISCIPVEYADGTITLPTPVVGFQLENGVWEKIK